MDLRPFRLGTLCAFSFAWGWPQRALLPCQAPLGLLQAWCAEPMSSCAYAPGKAVVSSSATSRRISAVVISVSFQARSFTTDRPRGRRCLPGGSSRESAWARVADQTPQPLRQDRVGSALPAATASTTSPSRPGTAARAPLSARPTRNARSRRPTGSPKSPTPR